METDRMILCMKMKSQRKVKVRIESSDQIVQNENENLFLANASTYSLYLPKKNPTL